MFVSMAILVSREPLRAQESSVTVALDAYLKEEAPKQSESFGWKVDCSGDTVAISAHPYAGRQQLRPGTVHLYSKQNGGWVKQASLRGANTELNDRFGVALDLDGDTLVVGAPGESSAATGINGNAADNSSKGSGAAYIFARKGTSWVQQAYLKASATMPDPRSAGFFFGVDVSVSGDTVVVGRHVYVRQGETWTLQTVLMPPDGIELKLGNSAVVSGDTILIRGFAPDPGKRQSGKRQSLFEAYVYQRSGGQWHYQARLSYPNTLGSFNDLIALSGDTAVIGVPTLALDKDLQPLPGQPTGLSQKTLQPCYTGAAFVFVRDGDMWKEQARLTGDLLPVGTQVQVFGSAVAVAGDSVLVGAQGDDSITTGINGAPGSRVCFGGGAAFWFTRSGGKWSQKAFIKPERVFPTYYFGMSVGMSADTLIIGVKGEDNTPGRKPFTPKKEEVKVTTSHSGGAYIYRITPP